MITTDTTPQRALEEEFLSEMQACSGIVIKLVRVYATEKEDQKDLQQEIILQAWRSYPSFKRASLFSTWLYRLGVNVALSWKRKKGRLPKSSEVPVHKIETPIEAIENPQVEKLYRCLHMLSPVDRTVISMHLDGYNHTEIGESLGVRAPAIATRIHRVRVKLQDLLTNKKA